jgi:catechol 2,3-dioxygenase-like lactoylglutathione lyase family enzyme
MVALDDRHVTALAAPGDGRLDLCQGGGLTAELQGIGCEMDEKTRRAKEQRKREDLLAGLRLETRLGRANPSTPARAEKERKRRYDRIVELLHKAENGSPETTYIDAETTELLRGELARLGRAAPGAALSHGEGPATPLVAVERFNTILYCRQWLPTVRFYRDELGLPVVDESDWFVEFRVTGGSSLSIADSARATGDHVAGEGITLSWRVTDLTAARERLVERELQPSEIRTVRNGAAFYIADPEGHRIEVWSAAHPDVGSARRHTT